jgi:cell division septum initiation protein DivIVA
MDISKLKQELNERDDAIAGEHESIRHLTQTLSTEKKRLQQQKQNADPAASDTLDRIRGYAEMYNETQEDIRKMNKRRREIERIIYIEEVRVANQEFVGPRRRFNR